MLIFFFNLSIFLTEANVLIHVMVDTENEIPYIRLKPNDMF